MFTSTTFSAVGTSSATLEATFNPNGANTTYHFEYVDDATYQSSGFDLAKVTPDGPPKGGLVDVPVSATLEGLTPATIYHFRLFAKNPKSPPAGNTGPERVFATYPLAPTFGPCANDAFRSGQPSAALPDCRAYEQASPIAKDGGDAIATVPLTKAAPGGGAVTFTSTSGAPGGEGAQELPLYLASRGPGGSGWSTRGLQPPAQAGAVGRVLGWSPGFSTVYSSAGSRLASALFAQPGGGGPLTQAVPYLPANYSMVGSAGEGAEVVFESRAGLPSSPAGVEGVSNVYAWDRETGDLSLVSVQNDGQALTKGAFGGSYDWALGMSANNLSNGGAGRNYYTQDTHAVAGDGSVYFTEAGTGQLYLRLNPTQPQSTLDPEGHCTEPAKACTLHVSATDRTPPDSAGAAPAAFQAASADGSLAYFTSPAKLTNDANTGPDQPEAKIGRSRIDGKTELQPGWLAGRRAVGVAVDSQYVYWADPVDGTIGRAELGGGNPKPDFIVPGPTTGEFETEPGSGKFETLEFPSKPRYVAVDAGHIYWTNTADGKDNHGTIGRAKIEGTGVTAVEPDCVKGASNPQGIAVNATHIYWANAGSGAGRSIGRAGIACDGAVANFQKSPTSSEAPQGVALSATHLYWTVVSEAGGAYISRVPLGGAASEEFQGLGSTSQPRGLALVGDDLYWATQGEEAIGHAVWPDAQAKPTTIEDEFIKLQGAPSGVAVGAEHLYWSTNGESQPNPGNDLYRFDASDPQAPTLKDLTPNASGNGAEVQGVLAASQDGSRVYFTANADLDGPGKAEAGNCTGPLRLAKGTCSLYLWREGTTSFIARLNATGSTPVSDAANWAPTTSGIFAGSDPQKTSFLSADGETLLFRSQQQLTAYDNQGFSQLYRYRTGEPLACLSCNPTGTAPKGSLSLGSIKPSALHGEEPAAVASRNLSADGNRAFFETTEALVAADTDGAQGCPTVGSNTQGFPACLDVYEWEAPGAGTCTESGPAYSPLNRGCLYLLSPGNDSYPSFFADASASGNDVFFFTRKGLVRQDTDQLLDLYDARALGGLAAQNPPSGPGPCEGEACKPAAAAPPATTSPGSASFQGPGNPPPKHKKKHQKKKHKKRHANHRSAAHNAHEGARR